MAYELIKARAKFFLHVDGFYMLFLYYEHSGTNRRYWNCKEKGNSNARIVTIGGNDNYFSYTY